MKKIILIGKPNVGKSTLFNKLLGKNIAITSDIPGTTRDVNFELLTWKGKVFEIQDPAGLALKSKEILINKAKDLTEQSLIRADGVIFVCDVNTGITNEDLEIAKTLRKSKREVFLAINKADAGRAEYDIGEFFKLGFGEPYVISAKRGLGIENLLENVTFDIEKSIPEKKNETVINVAILGRPNVGKSSFLNKLVGDDKFLVSDIAGTTRDINSQTIKHKDKEILFLDTAGIRRRGKVGNIPGSKDDGVIEKFAVERSKESLQTADVALVILDVQDKITAQDTHIIGEVIQENVGIILVVNKWDLATDGKLDETNIEMARFIRIIRNKVSFLSYAPVIFVSSKTGRNIDKIMDLILEIKENRERTIPTGELNRFIENINMMESGAPQKRAKVKYGTQTDSNPPTFLFFVGDPEKIHFSYKRFLENQMRHKWNFGGTPIKMIFRAK